MAKYRKKPVTVEAEQWWGRDSSLSKEGIVNPYETIEPNRTCEMCGRHITVHGWVDTLEGGHIVCPGDWIITGVKGERYSCKPDVFERTYEKLDSGHFTEQMNEKGGGKQMLTIRRAEFVYEGARLHAVTLGCPVVPAPWSEREADFRAQFIELIDDLCSGKREFQDFEEAHDSWMAKYFEMGWVYGPDYAPGQRIHPDLVPYAELDPKEKVKDEVFVRLVELARDCIWDGYSTASLRRQLANYARSNGESAV